MATEGGNTRMMTLCQSGQPNFFGPIGAQSQGRRSCRKGDLDSERGGPILAAAGRDL